MASITGQLVAGIVGRVSDADGWAGPVACLAVPVIPAVALVDVGAAAAGAVRGAVSWLRRRIGLAALAVAERCGVVPVATAASYPVATAAEAEEWPEGRWTLAPAVEAVPEAPVILPRPEPMPSAAQVTEPHAWQVKPRCAELLAQHGSCRAAARAVGVAESTFRGWCRKEGVKLPGRRAKG